jgi:hypothetical protein
MSESEWIEVEPVDELAIEASMDYCETCGKFTDGDDVPAWRAARRTVRKTARGIRRDPARDRVYGARWRPVLRWWDPTEPPGSRQHEGGAGRSASSAVSGAVVRVER